MFLLLFSSSGVAAAPGIRVFQSNVFQNNVFQGPHETPIPVADVRQLSQVGSGVTTRTTLKSGLQLNTRTRGGRP